MSIQDLVQNSEISTSVDFSREARDLLHVVGLAPSDEVSTPTNHRRNHPDATGISPHLINGPNGVEALFKVEEIDEEIVGVRTPPEQHGMIEELRREKHALQTRVSQLENQQASEISQVWIKSFTLNTLTFVHFCNSMHIKGNQLPGG